MKKNLILMTVLFAGSMIVNDGFGANILKVLTQYPTANEPKKQMGKDAKPTPSERDIDKQEEDKELPADREQLEQEKMRKLQTQLTETRGKLDSTQKELESAKKEKAELETKVKKLEESKEKIQAQLSEKENDLKKLTGQNDKFQKLQERLKEQGAALKKAQTQLSTKEEKLKKLQQEQQELRQKYDELETQLERLQQSYSDLEDERTTLAAQVNLITKQLPQINILLENVLGKSVTTGDLLTNITDDELGRQIAILNAYVHALQKLNTDDGTKKEMSKEEQKSIDKFIEDLHALNENVVIYTQEQPQKNDKKGIDGICFEIGQLHTNIAKLLKLYQNLSDKYSQITAQAFVEVKKEPPHPADETQRKHEEFAAQNKKSYWIPGWVKTIGVGVGLVATVLAKQYQNYSVTVPATPGTNPVCRYLCGTNHSVTHDIMWDTSTGSMRYLNGSEYEFGKLDIDRLNEAYPEPFKQYLNESQKPAEPQGTSWFSWVQTDNKPNEEESCNDYYEKGIKDGTATMKEWLEELQTQNSELKRNNTDLNTKLEQAKAEKTSAEEAKKAAEQAKTAAEQAKKAKDDLENCKTKKDRLNGNASFLTQQLAECTDDKTKANNDLKQCEADKANMYTQEEYNKHYNEGLNRGKNENKCPNTGSTISEEDQEIVRRYKEIKEQINKLDEKIKASSNFSPKNFKYLWEKIKLLRSYL